MYTEPITVKPAISIEHYSESSFSKIIYLTIKGDMAYILKCH